MAVLWITAADLSDPEHEMAPLIAEAASFILFKRSGQKYPGVQSVTEWYGRRGTSCWSCSSLSLYTDGSGNVIYPHGHRFYGSDPEALRTRGRPIVSVESVESAAGVLDPSEYKVSNNGVIYRTSGRWNFDTGVTVSYTYGMNPPSAGRLAAILLGDEMLLAYTDPDGCSLPERLTNVTRQGLSFSLQDLEASLSAGNIGIYEVDLFLSTVNPTRALAKPRVFSPDIPSGEHYS